MDVRIRNQQFMEPHRAILAALMKIVSGEANDVIIRVPDEDVANYMNSILMEAVDKIKIEFDSTEYGPNPLWTPSKLKQDNGKVKLEGAYDQTVHQDKSITPED